MLVAYCITSVGLGTFQLFQPKIAPQFGSEDPPLWCFEVAGWALLRRILSFLFFAQRIRQQRRARLRWATSKMRPCMEWGPQGFNVLLQILNFPIGPWASLFLQCCPGWYAKVD